MEKAFTKKKALGQNFLTSDNIPIRIASVCGADENTGVIEIGPGMGILTKQLVKIAPKVVAIELDEELIPYLNERFQSQSNFKLINNDVLKCDIDRILDTEFAGLDCCVCANLPYYITTPIIMMLLEGGYNLKCITVMVQKEVADRLYAKPREDGYGAITASVNYYAKVVKHFKVGAANFSPRPKVDSAVISLIPYKDKPVKPLCEKTFFEVLRGAFATRRKTLANSLGAVFGNRLSKEELQDIIAIDHSLTVRGEELSVAELAKISDRIYMKIEG
ncbi:MAG: ribosomal RNA small subunit methyltransferase A [Clostridia bacterium]|nr:ribosomal RNA small subunit methyltransferase A [Clostridia bacterium]